MFRPASSISTWEEEAEGAGKKFYGSWRSLLVQEAAVGLSELSGCLINVSRCRELFTVAGGR